MLLPRVVTQGATCGTVLHKHQNDLQMRVLLLSKFTALGFSVLGMVGCETPVAVAVLEESLASIAAGGQTTCALSASGVALCWGRGTDGQLGNGTSTNSFVPVLVRGERKFSSITVGFYHTCALTPAGEAYCWGATGLAQNAGQLGIGAVDRGTETPTRVTTSTRFVSLVAGQMHTCGLTAERTAHCWGDNYWGQLGDGTMSKRTVPVPVSGNHRFVELAAGDAHTCGVTDDGRVLCWGDNFSHAVTGGENTPAVCADRFDRRCTPEPFQVALPEPVRRVSAGSATCATTAAATTYCWGGSIQTLMPISRKSGNLSGVELGTGHGCGMNSAARLECWGAHRLGQLGSGVTPDDYTEVPVLVSGTSEFRQVSAGMFHTCAITADGDAFCWGANREGQLGVGTGVGPELCGFTHACSKAPVLVRTRTNRLD